MVPLNIFLDKADEAQRDRAIDRLRPGDQELAAANIFAGDLLFKNFGVTRYGRVVFYDYDEIDYLTNCNFRHMPQPADRGTGNGRRALVCGRAQRRFSGGIRHLPADRRAGARVHAPSRRPARCRVLAGTQQLIAAGQMQDVFPYAEALRFCNLSGRR